jgi:hypothetical protein
MISVILDNEKIVFEGIDYERMRWAINKASSDGKDAFLMYFDEYGEPFFLEINKDKFLKFVLPVAPKNKRRSKEILPFNFKSISASEKISGFQELYQAKKDELVVRRKKKISARHLFKRISDKEIVLDN